MSSIGLKREFYAVTKSEPDKLRVLMHQKKGQVAPKRKKSSTMQQFFRECEQRIPDDYENH